MRPAHIASVVRYWPIVLVFASSACVDWRARYVMVDGHEDPCGWRAAVERGQAQDTMAGHHAWHQRRTGPNGVRKTLVGVGMLLALVVGATVTLLVFAVVVVGALRLLWWLLTAPV